MKRESGIYQIRNLINNKIYIGKSINLYKRKSQHFLTLKNNKHKNFKLQGSVNKYGIENFVFEVLEKCTEIDNKEIEYINQFNSCKLGYNISSEVSHMSEEWISKFKYLRKTNLKYINQFDKCRSKADESNRIKINEYSLDGIYIKTWNSIIDASRFYNYKESSFIQAVLNFKRSRASNRLFRYYKDNIDNIEPYKSFRKTKLKFTSNSEELIFESGKEASLYFKTHRSFISVSLKKGYFKNYKLEKI